MATAAELINAQKAILRRTDPNAAAIIAADGTTLAQYVQTLLGQAETSTLPALIVYEYVHGQTQSQASLDTPGGGADFALKQFIYYRDVLKSANPEIGAYEAFGRALSESAQFHALSDGLSTAQFITTQYDALFGLAVASGAISAVTRTAGIAALIAQVEYFNGIYLAAKDPNGLPFSPEVALNNARAAVLGQMLGIAATTPALGLAVKDEAKAFLEAAVDGTAVFEAPFEATAGVGGGVITLTVQQVLEGAANGKHYILADRLDKIAANPDIMKNADSYRLTNATGGVGAITVDAAKVLLGAKNATNFDFSLADTGAAIKAASTTIINEADTIAVLGSKLGETLDFTFFSKSVILNGSDGSDILRGTKFNDVYYGGGGTNTYYTNGGSDTLRFSDSGTDLIFLTRSAAGGLTTGPMHIYGFGPGDKFIVSNADFSTNLEGSWTKDDFYQSGPLIRTNSAGNMHFDLVQPHTIGLFAISPNIYPSAEQDHSNFFAVLNRHNIFQDKDAFDMGVQWKGFFSMEDHNYKKTYIYYADSGSDTIINASEMKLVAIIYDSKGLDPLNAFMV